MQTIEWVGFHFILCEIFFFLFPLAKSFFSQWSCLWRLLNGFPLFWESNSKYFLWTSKCYLPIIWFSLGSLTPPLTTTWASSIASGHTDFLSFINPKSIFLPQGPPSLRKNVFPPYLNKVGQFSLLVQDSTQHLLWEDVLEFSKETEPIRYVQIHKKWFIRGISSHRNDSWEVAQQAVHKLQPLRFQHCGSIKSEGFRTKEAAV